MIKPIIRLLKDDESIDVRVISLCEFRRMDTPVHELADLGISYEILGSLKFKGATTSTGKKHIGGNLSPVRNLLRSLVWHLKIKPRLKSIYDRLPDLVVVPNDIAFPFDKICRWFRKKDISFMLFQEGIRFPLPNEGALNYGKNGAREILAWGKHSADYFRSLDLNKTAIVEAGNPRFDEMLKADYTRDVEQIHRELQLGSYNILYVSNPVDDQGFCSHDEKVDLFRKFMVGLTPILDKSNIKVLLRLHPREDASAFTEVIKGTTFAEKVVWAQKYPLFACLSVCDLSVVLASTVGLESMLKNVTVAVIKLGGHGYVFNYVQSHCALPIDLATDFSDILLDAITNQKNEWKEKCKVYTSNQLSNVGQSALFIANHLRKSLVNGQ